MNSRIVKNGKRFYSKKRLYSNNLKNWQPLAILRFLPCQIVEIARKRVLKNALPHFNISTQSKLLSDWVEKKGWRQVLFWISKIELQEIRYQCLLVLPLEKWGRGFERFDLSMLNFRSFKLSQEQRITISFKLRHYFPLSEMLQHVHLCEFVFHGKELESIEKEFQIAKGDLERVIAWAPIVFERWHNGSDTFSIRLRNDPEHNTIFNWQMQACVFSLAQDLTKERIVLLLSLVNEFYSWAIEEEEIKGETTYPYLHVSEIWHRFLYKISFCPDAFEQWIATLPSPLTKDLLLQKAIDFSEEPIT